MTDAVPGPRDWQPPHNKWLIALAVTLAAFMEILDTTIVNVSLPHIAGNMSVSTDDATWTLTSYLVANGIVLTISGWLSRVFGRKCYFLVCIGMFTLCSALCGLSQNLPELILCRLAQGFFGGGLQPTQQAILLDAFKPEERSRAFALTAIATVVAPVLGPALGGVITDNISWRWIFFINLPVGALALFSVMHLVTDPPWARRRSASIDAIGVGLIALGLGALQIMVDRGEDAGWFGSDFIRLMACLAAIGILGAIAWLLYTDQPVVKLRVLRDANFAVSSVLMIAMAAVLYASAVVIPLLAQQQLGYTATLAGEILSPGAFVVALLIPLASQVQQRVPTKFVIAFGFATLGGSMLYSHRLTPDVSFTVLAMMRIAQAAGLAFLFVPLTTIAFANISREDNGDASALFTMFRNVAGSIGISLSTAMITERTQVRMAHLASHVSPLDQGFAYTLQQYQDALRNMGRAAGTTGQAALGVLYQVYRGQAAVLAFMDIFAFCAVMAFAMVPMALLLSNKKGGGGPGGAH